MKFCLYRSRNLIVRSLKMVKQIFKIFGIAKAKQQAK